MQLTSGTFCAAPPDAVTALQDLVKFLWSNCHHCKYNMLWLLPYGKDDLGNTVDTEGAARIIVPPVTIGPTPNVDLPDTVKADYEEARSIAAKSPRAAAALLRLALQKLANKLLGNAASSNLFANIGTLVSSGVPRWVQQALDAVRAYGNEGVHPGTINLNDTPETVETLFICINEIAEALVSRPQRIGSAYEKLPPAVKAAIAKRDAGGSAAKPADAAQNGSDQVDSDDGAAPPASSDDA